MGTSSRTLKQRAYREMKEYLVITFYLWVVFVLFRVYRSVILAEHHIDYASHGFALINALALAKVMLVARKLHLADHAKDAPLIYPTLLKSAVFSVVLAGFKILEEVAVGLYHGQSFQQSTADIGAGGEFLPSQRSCAWCSSLSSDSPNCKEFLARRNWSRSFSAGASLLPTLLRSEVTP